MSRYYLLSGLSRIFRKPFTNVYISRKVPFAQTFQIYACGPRSYKTFHGFLHDSHINVHKFYVNIEGPSGWSGKNTSNTVHFLGPRTPWQRLLGFLFTVDRPGCHAVQSGSGSRSKDKGRHIKSGFLKVDSNKRANARPSTVRLMLLSSCRSVRGHPKKNANCDTDNSLTNRSLSDSARFLLYSRSWEDIKRGAS